ncbi:MAG: S-methyl-5-thioribose-1-phosphate isomerase [Ktedonobacteraceae bacterium]|nr:S-methyl-5-thioribose-1-phosphate isomerase [Ktedonobacteraceae bacterium]
MTKEKMQPKVQTIWWEESPEPTICMLDQSLLPHQVVYLRHTHEQQVADAIKALKVRGAPVIGITAAFGIALAFSRLFRVQAESLSTTDIQKHLVTVCELFCHTRPTAVNLFAAVEHMQHCAKTVLREQGSLQYLAQKLYHEAQSMADEDFDACLKMGAYGVDLIADGDILLTHCNAGTLATVGWGTGLAPIYAAHRAGKRIHIFVDETRPVLQGARLTAWELQQEGIPLTLITDNMAGHFMRHGGIKAVFVGADRITCNGDVANKIGTYSLAVLAHAHHIPFYVVAPRSTIDLSLPSGEHIPIEQRDPREVTFIHDQHIAPVGVKAANPAFDVTPHMYVSAIITDMGIARPPYSTTLHSLYKANKSVKM